MQKTAFGLANCAFAYEPAFSLSVGAKILIRKQINFINFLLDFSYLIFATLFIFYGLYC